jgi:hypothetical protein
MQKGWKTMIMYCEWCGKEVETDNMPNTSRRRALDRGWCYCSKECSVKGGHKKDVWTEERRQKASEHMKKVNAEFHSQIIERMTTNNPMKNPETREKVSKRLKEIGHHPRIRCGNGMGLTVPQQTMLLALAEKVEVYAEYPIPTKMNRASGYPTCYKVDIAIPAEMIAIEVDGASHCAVSRQEQDRKKEAFLSGLGWTVLRFRNKQVTEHLEECVEMVMSTISK